MADRSRTMLLMDGSLPALVAASMWHEERLFHSEAGGSSRAGERAEGFGWIVGQGAMQRAAESHARLFDLKIAARSDAGPERASSIVVLAGAIAAARLGCGRLVWPVHGGDALTPGGVDLDTVAEAIDRATLVGRLASLDTRCEIDVETPFVDLSDRQIVDLAIDMGVDTETCWWATAGERSPDADAERRRWRAAMREAGALIGHEIT